MDESIPALDEMNRRLAEIDAALDTYARDPSPEQFALLTERDTLRARAAAYRTRRDASRSSTDLETELRSLRAKLRSAISSRTGYVTAKGGGNHSPSPGAWLKLSAQSRAAGEFGKIQVRIAAIEDELRSREESD